jgi:RHS repeat-associated protein
MNDYYPFGAPFSRTGDFMSWHSFLGDNGYEYEYGSDQAYKFGGKEFETGGGLNSYDFGARTYDPAICRFGQVDPLAEKYYGVSPYVYCGNNPIRYIDPTGMNYGDYFNYSGNYLGNDGFNDGKIYLVDGVSKFNMTDFEKNGKYYKNQSSYNKDNGDGYSVKEADMNSDLGLLSRIGYAEFRGSNNVEQQVGMDITLNRVSNNKFPNTLSEVITQPFQYSSLNSGDPNKVYYDNPAGMLTNNVNMYAWIKTVSNAISVMYGNSRGISQGATLYYSPRSMKPQNAMPKWNFDLLQEVNVDGARKSHIRLFKYK